MSDHLTDPQFYVSPDGLFLESMEEDMEPVIDTAFCIVFLDILNLP